MNEEFGKENISEVKYLPGFYQLPSNVKISTTSLYKKGQIYGIDVSSGVAVGVLDVKPGDHCLDLCTAPGAKLSMMADLASPNQESLNGSATGIDISENRLNVCKNMLKKYKSPNVRLFLMDGRNFNEPPPSVWQGENKADYYKNLQNIESKKGGVMKPIYSTGRLYEGPHLLYDKVLVDVECTHDGSLKHILKYNEWGWETFENKFLQEERISSISQLQKELLENGFRMLKPGGTLVYSTCSLSKAQNEDVVSLFLEEEKCAKLLPIDVNHLPDESCLTAHISNKNDPLWGTVRFNPILHGTSGLFIAKITKIKETSSQIELEISNQSSSNSDENSHKRIKIES